jgi:hypothetical protein
VDQIHHLLIIESIKYKNTILASRTRFGRYRRCRVPFSCFALSDIFLAVPRASGPVFMFRAPGPVFDGTDGAVSRFIVLRSRTNFRRYRGRRLLFSCFALQDPFSAVSTSSGLVLMLCTPWLIFSGTEGVGSRYHVAIQLLTKWKSYMPSSQII